MDNFKTIIRKLFNRIYEKVYVKKIYKHLIGKTDIANEITRFHKLYYNSWGGEGTWKNMFWLGVPILKNPLDLWIFQEIIHSTKPDVIIECGTKFGGSALYLASLCDLENNGKIITIDIEDQENKPQHKRIQYLIGSSTSEEISNKVKSLVNKDDKALVILDSYHAKDHVLEELKTYSEYVKKGGYVIVEDTHLNGYPVSPFFGPGPMEAVKEFLKFSKDFKIDKSKEKFFMTWNPNGYLKRIK